MKFLLAFACTFALGLSVYFLTLKKELIEVETATRSEIKISSTKLKSVEIKPVILEENNDWENDSETIFKVKLLEVGEGFHGDQVDAKNGEVWFELFYQDSKFYLKQTKLKIARVHDEVVDEENVRIGKSVSTEKGENSVFLLKNADFLKEGTVETLFHGKSHLDDIEEDIDYSSLRVGFRKEFTFGTDVYVLSVKKGVNINGEKIISLILDNNGVTQTLHSNKYFAEDDYLGSLYWVGDLDKDEKPDFYFDLFFNENIENKNLFLSSKAAKGKLLKKVAVFITTGC